MTTPINPPEPEPAMPLPSEPDITASAETSKSVKPAAKPRPPKPFHQQYPRLARLFSKLMQQQEEYFLKSPITPLSENMEEDDVCLEFHLKLSTKHGKPTIIRGVDMMPMVLDVNMHPEALANFSDTLRLKMIRPAETAFQRLMTASVNKSNQIAIESGKPPSELTRSNS